MLDGTMGRWDDDYQREHLRHVPRPYEGSAKDIWMMYGGITCMLITGRNGDGRNERYMYSRDGAMVS
jgi:hypothetical protein